MSKIAIGMVSAEGERRKRLKVLDWGDNPNSHGGRLYVGEKLMAAFAERTYPYRLIPLDYEHNTVPTTAAYKETKEPRDIAGYGVVEVMPEDGVYITMVLWAVEPDGWEMAHRYADISATAVMDIEGNVVAIKSVALTRVGATDKHFLDVSLSAAGAAGVKSTEQGKEGNGKMDWSKVLIELLGLKADATDEEIKAALAVWKGKTEKGADGSGTPADADTPTAPLAAEVANVVNAAVAPLATQVQALQAENHKHKVDRVLEQARLEGKVVPMSVEAAYKLEMKVLEEIVGQTPVTVPLSAITPATVREPKLDGAGPTAEQRAIAESCGLSAEAVWPSKAETKA